MRQRFHIFVMHHFQRPIFLDKIIVNYDALLQIVLSTANTGVVDFQSISSYTESDIALSPVWDCLAPPLA